MSAGYKVPCGTTIGHGDACVKGRLCSGCFEIERLRKLQSDMLAALRKICTAADNLDPQSGMPVGYQALLDAMDVGMAAIAKATGGAT